ncbi:MAG: hypothetical protein ABW044_10015 [Cellvibrio sp.]
MFKKSAVGLASGLIIGALGGHLSTSQFCWLVAGIALLNLVYFYHDKVKKFLLNK